MPLDREESGHAIELLIPSMTCAGCMSRVESTLKGVPGVINARANLTKHLITVRIDPGLTDADGLVDELERSGFPARPFDPSLCGTHLSDQTDRALLLRIGVAGFAAMNVMLLSISVWSGADAATRDLLHWISALIALPAIVYAGEPFYRSAASVLSAGRLNMDVPITLAIALASISSVVETSAGGTHAWFDAGIMLIFFLLIGRYLEHRTRARARSAAAEMTAMSGRTALRVLPDGTRELTPVARLSRDMLLEVAPGERIPADGIIKNGRTDLDRSLITGESHPEPASTGDLIHAGMLNLTGAIRMRVTETGDATLLGEIARMIDAAERGRTRHDRIADRAARIYAPAVHALAAIAFLSWYWTTGEAWTAIQIATAVLIVTCPCALALAIPTVHTVTSSRLFRDGIFLKDGAELERLAEVDTVVFDKTGTLTDGRPRISHAPDPDDTVWPLAAALARASRHPLSQAIASEAERLGIAPADVEDIHEIAGLGVEGVADGARVRLGRSEWTGGEGDVSFSGPDLTAIFRFSETLKPGAIGTCAKLRAAGLRLAILSGDAAPAVERVARQTGISEWMGGLMPGEKLAWLEAQRRDGRRVLMVGDGLNDGPALAAAHASMSPASATDIAKTAAGFVFTGETLGPVASAIAAAKIARRRGLQSFGIALAYNAIAIPLAMAGWVTPLFAAVAMSASSILVVLNALRRGPVQ